MGYKRGNWDFGEDVKLLIRSSLRRKGNEMLGREDSVSKGRSVELENVSRISNVMLVGFYRFRKYCYKFFKINFLVFFLNILCLFIE